VFIVCCVVFTDWKYSFKTKDGLIFNNNPFVFNTSKSKATKNIKNNDWIIMLSVNSAYLDFYFNWLAAYKQTNLTYLIFVITEDNDVFTYFDKHKTKNVKVIESEFPQIKNSVVFGSPLFNQLSVRRHTYILKKLQQGINIVFSDTDTVWLKNPFLYFTGKFGIWMQLDKVGFYCPGTMAVKSSKVTISFFKKLTKGLSSTSQPDQPFMNKLIKKSDVLVQALPTFEFPSGRQYFDTFSNIERRKAVVVHNNWLIGHEAKRDRFLKYNLWFFNNVSAYGI
jgi:hypothetical protein